MYSIIIYTHKLIVRLMVIELATVFLTGKFTTGFMSMSEELFVRGHPVVFVAGCVVAIFVCVCVGWLVVVVLSLYSECEMRKQVCCI